LNTYDYIIVGAGSAGSVLANRLSASGSASVLLLEAGGSDRKLFVQVPIGYGKTYYDKRVNWKYQTEPEQQLNNRPSYWPRGKVMGGSSSINAMVYVRGHPLDYDDWSKDAPGWDWSNIAPLFNKLEDWDGTPHPQRGKDGLLSVTDTQHHVHKLCDTFLNAAEQSQIPFNADYNAESMEGASLYQITTKDGLRGSTAHCYLRPALTAKNLQLELNAHVAKVLFDGKRAKGVQYRQGGKVKTAEAARCVILCGGAVNTPQLLQLSGIGSASLLTEFEIPVVVDQPQVGENLQDHLGADMICRTSVPSLNQELRPLLARTRAIVRYLLKRTGPLALSVNQAGGFIKLNPQSDRPDTQLYFSPLSYTRAPIGTRPLIKPDPFPGFMIGYNPCKPTSKGHLSIQSADPFVQPKIVPNYLSTEHDRNLMLDGMRLMRTLTSTEAMQRVIEEEIYPGAQVQSDDELNQFISENAWTVFHPCGTCRMGDDPNNNVVDSRLRVHGIAGLRVADASIFPTIPTGNTNAPTIVTGEKAAELILADNK
jgi:choline dehydrogenase